MPSSNHPDAIAFDESLPPDGLATFIQEMTQEDGRRDDILGLPNDPSAEEEVVNGIYVKSMDSVLDKVRPTLKRIVGSHWKFSVRRNHDVIAFDNALPQEGLASFIRKVVDDLELKKTILRLPKKRSTDELTIRGIYADCMEAALRQVRDNLEEIFGEDWSFEVKKNSYMLNGTGTDLGTKYKDTELYKAYVKLVDGPDVTGGLRMLYDHKKPSVPDLNAAETTTDAIAAPITPSDSPPADNLLTIDPDLVTIDDHPIEIDDAHDTSDAVITDEPIADTSEDVDTEVDVADDLAVTHWGYLFSPIQRKIGTNATSTSTSIRKSRNRFDITLLAEADASEKSDHEGPAQMVGGVVEVRYVSEKEVEGTVLAIPSEALGIKEESITKSKKGIDDHLSASVLSTPRGETDRAEVTERPPSFFTRRILQDLIAQIIWGLINVDAMPTTRRPVYGMAVLNGWFVRMIVDGAYRVVYLETRDPTRISTNPSTSTDRKTSTHHQTSAPKSSSLKDLETWFQHGRFPHHLATTSGVEKLYHWTIAGFRSFVLTAALTTNKNEDADSGATASSAKMRIDLKRGAADVSAHEELEGMDREKRTRTVCEEDSSQARDPAGPSSSYQAIKEEAERTVPDEPRRKVNTWLSKIDNNPEADQTPVAVQIDEPFNVDDEDDDIHNSSDSQEYRDYWTVVGQLGFLDQLGWTVEYCSIARFDELLYAYGTSKLVSEIVARSFHTRDPSMDIYILRIGSLVQPEDYKEQFPEFLKNPEKRRYSAWSHIDARDLGQMCRLGVEKDGLGYQVFNAINDHITTLSPTLSTLQRYAPDVPIRREMGEYEAPFFNRKIKEVLGFKEEFDWRDQVPNLDEIRKEVEAMNGGSKA